jgi:hypothetical protein
MRTWLGEKIPARRPARGIEILADGQAARRSAQYPGALPNRAAGGPGERSLIVPIGANTRFPYFCAENTGPATAAGPVITWSRSKIIPPSRAKKRIESNLL